MPFRDKEHAKQYMREYRRLRMTETQKTKARRRMSRRKRELADWFQDFKSNQRCVRCEESDPCCLEFHHRNSQSKEIALSKAIWSRGWCKERVLKEMAKCDIVCANCHRKIHAGR